MTRTPSGACDAKRISSRGWLLLVAMTLAGCSGDSQPLPSAPPPASTTKPLRVLVIDDPELATAIERQWQARAGGPIEVRNVEGDRLFAKLPNRLNADAVIYPSDTLGELAEAGLIDPLPKALLDDPQLARRDIFPLLRQHEIQWSGQTMAVPLGSPPWLLIYRQDLFDQLQLAPPSSWSAYQRAAEQLAAVAANDAEGEPWQAVVEPLADGWAGKMLLARAAAYASHQNFYSTLLDLETMEPLVDGPPLVRALEELVAAAKLGPPNATEISPAEAWQAVLAGRCGMAVTWPRRTFDESSPPSGVRLGVAGLPPSRDVYHRGVQKWEQRDVEQAGYVTLLGVAGRLGSVTRESPQSMAAAKLLIRLSSSEWSVDVSPSSQHTAPFRQSQLTMADRWLDSSLAGELAPGYAEQLSQTFARDAALPSVRIPGRRRYMAALDEAVQQAVAGERTPQQALQTAADRWRQITAEIGVETQKKSLWHSWGFAR